MAARSSPTRPRAPDEDPDRIAAEVRGTVRRAGPALPIEKKWGQPWFVGTDMVCGVGSFTHHLGVEFWRGRSLKDSNQLLEGTGKNLRLVKLHTAAEANAPPLEALVREAIRLDRAEPKRKRLRSHEG